MPSRRQERVNGRIVQEVSEAVRELKDPRIGFVTITRAEVSPDLRHASIFVSVLGEQEQIDASMEGLLNSAKHIRKTIGAGLSMKYTPELHFKYDHNIHYADNMSRLIAEARATDPGLSDDEDETDPASDS